MSPDEFLLSEFKKVLLKNTHEKIINLDDTFGHDFDLYIERAENIFNDTDVRAIPPNRWSYHRMILVNEGSVDFMTGIYKFSAQKNTLVVIPARVITSSKNWSHDIRGYLALFKLDFFLQNNFPRQCIENKKILNPTARPYVSVTEEQAEEIAHVFEAIMREKESAGKNKDELVVLKVLELLILNERLFEHQNNFDDTPPSSSVIKKFIELLDENYLKKRSVSFYAAQLSVHPNYLNAVIKKHTGLTAKETIQNRLMLETKYLLHSTNLSIKEISSQLGFNDPNYFTSFFKQFENISPANYRSSKV
ncbi:MAG TPA: AraC family transcriptional regulator [Puia sp.]|nr:AraC family transcriptional regulator [Puia sp.]